MSEKNIKKESISISISKATNDVLLLVEKKIDFFKDIIQKTIIHVQKNKTLDILGISDVSTCIEKLGELSKKIEEMGSLSITSTDIIINNLQIINNELSSLLKSFGTDSLEDLLLICFGNNNKITTNEEEYNKFELLKKYFHPTSYRVITKKDQCEITGGQEKKVVFDKKKDEIDIPNLSCLEVQIAYKQFHMKVYGIKVYIHSIPLKKSLLIYGIVDDIVINFLHDRYIKKQIQSIKDNTPSGHEFQSDFFDEFISALTLKDFLIYETPTDMYAKFAGTTSQYNYIKQKQISQAVKDFIADDMFNKRTTLVNLLIRSSNYENQYLAYLFYDLLSNDANGTVDTQDQTILFDSFPWSIKQLFKQAMKKTVQYTNELSNFDINKIPLEQQICLLKSSDAVKEKAMMKLKEVKTKSEDSGSKARQYLDGLLKIPFGVYKREPILNMMEHIRNQFKSLYKKHGLASKFPNIPQKDKYMSIEIMKYLNQLTGSNTGILSNNCNNTFSLGLSEIEKLEEFLTKGDKKIIKEHRKAIDSVLEKHNKPRSKFSNLTKDELIEQMIEIVDNYSGSEDKTVINDIYVQFKLKLDKKENNKKEDNKKENNKKEYNKKENTTNHLASEELQHDIEYITTNISSISTYMVDVKNTLDRVVYGHEKAKKQIERIIGQWINGDIDKNTSHVLGFEGNPGIGKTTLAKGLSECLKDENGNSRPFALIALGGDSNASTLVGFSYTYVGSSWGSLVQILIDNKCMNPIILFDEVDKISKTEHGREITGILTHLLDTTQNKNFQDKYFAGIDLDLSNALFILSYNDPESVDKILLDRVHRIRFDSLTMDDKIVISNKHLLPEIYKQVGLEDMIHFSDETLKYIIEEHTLEPGVRKLKEKYYEVIADINLEILKTATNNIDYSNASYNFPIEITIEDIKTKYFKDKRENKVYKIHDTSKVGVINALWANQMSQGGVLPLQASFIPARNFLDLTLTGSMGDVMKESINVSLTNAWNLTSQERQKWLIEKYNDTKNNIISGIHIHCPDISTRKDGPSATTAFTILIYSLLNDVKIKNHFGITGETHFGYCLTEIGGLEEKIIHSIKSGITEFIFPRENQKDFDKIMDKYKKNKIIEGIQFHPIHHIDDAFNLILDK
jgi:ATP-dependent Lon protease